MFGEQSLVVNPNLNGLVGIKTLSKRIVFKKYIYYKTQKSRTIQYFTRKRENREKDAEYYDMMQ